MGTESAVSSTITASVSKWNSTCCIISLRCFPWLVLWQILCTPVDSRPALLSSIAVFFRKASQQSCKSVWMCCMYYCTCWWRWAIHPVQTKWFTSSLYLHPAEMDSRSHLALKYILNAPGVNTWGHISPHCSYLVLSVVLTLDLSVSIMKYWTGHSRRTTNMKKWPPNVAWVTLHVLNMSWGGVFTLVFSSCPLGSLRLCFDAKCEQGHRNSDSSLCPWLKTQLVYCSIKFNSVDSLQLF